MSIAAADSYRSAATEASAMTREAVRQWANLIRAEYLEMPGLSLSNLQARRLWGLDGDTCDVLLDEMVDANFLRRTVQNLYVCADTRA
jgi:hypothetical protein